MSSRCVQIVGLLAFTSLSIASPPPETLRQDISETMHGEVIEDPYRWLEDLEVDSPEVEAWTAAQNEHTRGFLDELPCRATLASEFKHLMAVPSIGTPVTRGGLLFNTERKIGENQASLFVREHGGEPRTLINPNTLDADGLISLDWWVPSPDGSLVAFGISRAGDEMSILHVLKTATGDWTPLEIPGKARLSSWTPNGDGFVYSLLSDPKDPYSRTAKWHTIGRHTRHDQTIVTQSEPSRIPYASLSRNGKWLILGLTNGWGVNDLWVASAEDWKRDGTLNRIPLAVDIAASFRAQAVIGDTLYLQTTHEAPNGNLFAVDLHSPNREDWVEIVPEHSDQVLQGASRAPGMLVLTWEKDAVTVFERIRVDGSIIGPIALPGLGSAGISTEYDSLTAYMSYTSYNEPRTIYRVDLATATRMTWARPEVAVDPSEIVVEREWAVSKDGTRVPMFVIHHRDVTPTNGPHPTLIYGYGGFNISMTPYFSSTNFPWYQAGGVYVVANLRGGNEYGEAWHRDGMLGSKQNVFDDLYACAEHLIAGGWTLPENLAVMGGSNGGLLTGVAVTQRPELWNAVVSSVPLLDMLRYHQFLMARFWVPEYGSSEDPEQFGWLKAYSPYHNIEMGKKYPSVLIKAGENDSRVHPLHARKMAARMQWAVRDVEDSNPVLLWVEHDAGHGQGKPLSMRIEALADTWSFIMSQTGLCQEETP